MFYVRLPGPSAIPTWQLRRSPRQDEMQVLATSGDNAEEFPPLCEQAICVLFARNPFDLETTLESVNHATLPPV
jgi:hypothetical protein